MVLFCWNLSYSCVKMRCISLVCKFIKYNFWDANLYVYEAVRVCVRACMWSLLFFVFCGKCEVGYFNLIYSNTIKCEDGNLGFMRISSVV